MFPIGFCAARSVHLSFQPTEDSIDLFYNEVIVERTTPGSYFMVCGFNSGYFGIQQLTIEEKIVIFSVWDPTKGDDPNQVALNDKVVVENPGQGVQVHRFGGEGTGAKLTAPLPWKEAESIVCFVTAHRENELSCYTGWIKHSEKDDWWRLGTLKTRVGGVLLRGLYSFIEDFRRDVHSANQNRKAVFSNGWVRTVEGKWSPLFAAKFTASNAEWEAKDTIDAGTCSKGFYLSTGGDVCSSTNIGCQMTIDCRIHGQPPTLPIS